jgi:hypothetical protein
MKITLVLAVLIFQCIISSANSKRLFYNNDDDMELSDDKARMFLRSMMNDDDAASSLDTREIGKNCVACKFGINPCCAPNICVKKRWRPDECMEVKQGK